jgi:chitin-binding protein
MPFGSPGFLTTAWAAQVGQPGLQTVALPKDGLVQGTNRLAVEVHQAVANDTDAFFDATISGVATSTDVTAPTAPGALTVTERTKTAIRLTWTASTDNVGVVVYRLKRGTTTIAYRQASSSLTYFEQQLTQGTNYTFTVVAVDAAGNESPVATVATSTLP